MKNFIILTTQRTGSTWLGTLLDSHPDVKIYGELFLPHDVPEKYEDLRRNDPDKFFRFRLENKGLRPWITWKYLNHVFNHHPDHIGSFKLMARPMIQHLEILFYLKKHKIPVILLQRNLAHRVLSYALAEHTGHFHTLDHEKQHKKQEKSTLDIKNVKKITKKQKIYDLLLKIISKMLKNQVLTIKYEDLEANTGGKLVDIYHFLGLNAVSGDSPIKKTDNKHYADLIENYGDVMKAINGL